MPTKLIKTHNKRIHGYTSPNTKIQLSKIDKFGLFAKKIIPKGTVVAAWGGCILTSSEIKKMKPSFRTNYALEIYPGFYIAETNEKELDSSDFINHSCQPNCKIVNLLVMITLKDVKIGEELTADFDNPNHTGRKTKCTCKSINCKKIVYF